jgi:hypothetical protein
MSTLAVKNVLVLQTPWWSPGHTLNATPVTLKGTGAGVAVAVGDVALCVRVDLSLALVVCSTAVGVIFPVLLVVGVLL